MKKRFLSLLISYVSRSKPFQRTNRLRGSSKKSLWLIETQKTYFGYSLLAARGVQSSLHIMFCFNRKNTSRLLNIHEQQRYIHSSFHFECSSCTVKVVVAVLALQCVCRTSGSLKNYCQIQIGILHKEIKNFCVFRNKTDYSAKPGYIFLFMSLDPLVFTTYQGVFLMSPVLASLLLDFISAS